MLEPMEMIARAFACQGEGAVTLGSKPSDLMAGIPPGNAQADAERESENANYAEEFFHEYAPKVGGRGSQLTLGRMPALFVRRNELLWRCARDKLADDVER